MIQMANQQKLVFAWGVVLLVVRTTNLLSLFVEWVKLFTDKVTRGGKMKKWMLAICLMFINEICRATDCFDLAGRDYKIDPDLLRAISWKESRYRVNAIGINPVTGYGSGLMQVDSQHFNELARYGIKPEHLTTDPCMNIYTGAYYLAIAFKKMGRHRGRWCIQCRIQEIRTPEPETSCLRIRGLPDLYRDKKQ